MDRGNAQPAMRPSRVVAMAGLLCGESRSGPDLSKLGWRGACEGGHATGCAVRRGLHLVGHNAIGFEAICCCARGSNWSQKSAAALGGASRKRATQGTPTMEGALDRGSAPPLTRRRAEAVLVLPQGSATEGVRGKGHGFFPGRKRREEGASRGELEITSSQVRASLVLRETGGQSCTRAEAMGSPSSEASLDHALRQGFDRAGGVEATLTGESRGRR